MAHFLQKFVRTVLPDHCALWVPRDTDVAGALRRRAALRSLVVDRRLTALPMLSRLALLGGSLIWPLNALARSSRHSIGRRPGRANEQAFAPLVAIELLVVRCIPQHRSKSILQVPTILAGQLCSSSVLSAGSRVGDPISGSKSPHRSRPHRAGR